MALLEVESIDVFYGNVQALRGVSLTVEAGEMVAIIGANGAGKTTTLRAISGMVPVQRGSIRIDGREVQGMPSHQVVRLGVTHLPEGRDLFPSLTVDENLRMGYWVNRGDREGLSSAQEHVMDLFPRLRERARQAAGTLSGGEQQMLGVARALMSSPRLLVVDELSLGLAPLVVEQLFEALRAVNQDGTAILLVEQFVHLALENTGRAYVLAKGEVVMSKPSAELKHDPELVASYLGGNIGEEEPDALAGEVLRQAHVVETV